MPVWLQPTGWGKEKLTSQVKRKTVLRGILNNYILQSAKENLLKKNRYSPVNLQMNTSVF